ncbi:tail length tape-measure protein [Vibrio phage phiKT1019]|nr:tail length tape-measure protein [Vibrio phage phiKT1019]
MSKAPNFVPMGTATGSGVKLSDGEQLIDMDEVYDDKHTEEETKALSEYLRTGKLSKKALVQQKVAGTERFEPACTELNGILGGESFLKNIAKSAAEFIIKIIRMIADSITWLVNKVRSIASYFSDNREVQKSEELLRDIEDKLMQLGGPSFNLVNVKELFEDRPAVARRLQIVRLLKARNEKVIDAVSRLNDNVPKIKNLINELGRHEAGVNKTKSTFLNGVKYLRKRVKEGSLTMEDVGRWEAQVNDLVSNHLQTHNLKAVYVKLAAATALDKEDQEILNAEQQFSDFSKMMAKTQELTKDTVAVEDFVQMQQYGASLRKVIADDPGAWDVVIDLGDAKELQDLVNKKDLEFFQEISDKLGIDRPIAIYREFASRCANYVSTIRQCVDTAVRYGNEVRYLAEWSQRYDLILGVYSLETTKQRKNARQEYYDKTGIQLDTANLKDVPEDGLDGKERAWRNLYARLFPGLKNDMNTLSRKLNAGVTVK